MTFKTNKWNLSCIVAVFFALSIGNTVHADNRVAGVVAKLSGELTAENNGSVGKMAAGNIVNMDDLLRTGINTRADLRFLDGSLMTMGDDAVIAIDKLVYNPEGNDSGGAINLIKGAFHLVSGKISKSENEFVINTPTATIGIRGTDFIAIQSGEDLSVLLLDNGIITVSNTQGKATLNQPGQGIDIKGINGLMSDVKMWPKGRKEKAVASVSW